MIKKSYPQYQIVDYIFHLVNRLRKLSDERSFGLLNCFFQQKKLSTIWKYGLIIIVSVL